MKKLFENLTYLIEKVTAAYVPDEMAMVGDYALADAAYKTIKDKIDEAESEIVAKYGSLENVNLDYEFGILRNLFDLLENHLDKIPFNIKAKFKYYLCSDMCTRVRRIAECYDKIDQEMDDNY